MPKFICTFNLPEQFVCLFSLIIIRLFGLLGLKYLTSALQKYHTSVHLTYFSVPFQSVTLEVMLMTDEIGDYS